MSTEPTLEQIPDESFVPISSQSLPFRLKRRAEIRRQNTQRKSVQEGAPDRISDLLEEAAVEIYQHIVMNKTSSIRSYYEGLREGVSLYAYWKDGVQYVGTCGRTLAEVLAELHEQEQYALRVNNVSSNT